MATTDRAHWRAQMLPVAVVALAVVVVWYLAAWGLNSAGAIERVLAPKGHDWTWQDLWAATMAMHRPVMPAPHQVALDFWSSLVDWPVNSPRNLLFHVWVTGEATLLGFVMGAFTGLVLAALIVHSPTLDRALLPWIVASQTVPVLAIAPIVLVILGSLGFSGVLPKAVIAMYLCFFPVTNTTVRRSRCHSCCNCSFRPSRVISSSAPKGSSIIRMRGSKAMARAIDTRCCMPPDSCQGYFFSNPAKPTRVSCSRATACASAGARP